MTTQPNPYLGDPIKSIKITELDFGKSRNGNAATNNRAQTAIQRTLKTENITYVGDLNKYVISMQGKAVDGPNGILPNIGKKYTAVIIDTLKSAGYNIKVLDDQVGKIGNHPTSKPMHGFCAGEFRIVSEDADNVDVRFKFELPQIFGDLVKHAHLCLDEMTRLNEGVEHRDEKIISDETKATSLEYSPDGEEITLIYEVKKGGLTALSSLGMHPSQAMANAANILTPIGQKRTMKRYGIEP